MRKRSYANDLRTNAQVPGKNRVGGPENQVFLKMLD
jgi:hypothetical protein